MSYDAETRPTPLPPPAVPPLALLHAGAKVPEPAEWMVREAQIAFETKLAELVEAEANRQRLETWRSRRAVRFSSDEPLPAPQEAVARGRSRLMVAKR